MIGQTKEEIDKKQKCLLLLYTSLKIQRCLETLELLHQPSDHTHDSTELPELDLRQIIQEINKL